MTDVYPLRASHGHLFADIGGRRWLIDTGASTSFGQGPLVLAGAPMALPERSLGLDAATLSALVGSPCDGLLGGDVLNAFDHTLDVPAGTLTVSTAPLPPVGTVVPLRFLLGVPVVRARVGAFDGAFFLDTGAQLSYFQHYTMPTFTPAGRFTDFYPGFGTFDVDTVRAPAQIGDASVSLRLGQLPPLMGAALLLVAGVQGVLGNEMLQGHRMGYAPRRQEMSLS
jgi:hypothetical protein